MLNRMRELPNWVVWKKSGDKVPLDPRTLKAASSTNPDTWVTFEVAQKRVELEGGAYGLGFVLNKNGIVAIDIDDCLSQDKKIPPLASIFVRKAQEAGAYIEVSPSGKGLHILYYGEKDFKPCKFNLLGETVEIYDDARYITYTANRITDYDDDQEKHDRFSKFVNKFAKAFETLKTLCEIVTVSPHYKRLFDGDWSEYPSQSEADLAFVSFIAKTTRDPEIIDMFFRMSGLYRKKWDELRGELTYGERTISKAIEAQPDDIEPKSERVITGDPFPLTEYGNAHRLSMLGKDYLYDNRSGEWYKWNESHGVWEVDPTDGFTLYERLINHLNNTALHYTKLAEQNDYYKDVAKSWHKWSLRSQSKSVLSNSLSLAQKLLGKNVEWDSDFEYLNTPSGVIDLRTGKVLKHKKKLFHKNQTNVPLEDGEPELFKEFLYSIFEKDEIVAFMKRVLGYSLIGGNREQRFFILWGPGGNGKTTLLNIMQKILGTYAASTQPETFVARMNAIPSDIARLRGKRFIATSEPVSSGSLNAALVKRITGGDTLLVRFMYHDWFEMRVVGVPFMTTNVQPSIKDTDDGIWRRIVQIPFKKKLSEQERIPNYDDLIVEREGGKILRWLVEGAIEYMKEGLKVPRDIKHSTDEYRNSQDIFQIFMDDVLEPKEGFQISLLELQQVYTNWCRKHGMHSMWLRRFQAVLAAKGVPIEDKMVKGYTYTDYGMSLIYE